MTAVITVEDVTLVLVFVGVYVTGWLAGRKGR